MGEKCREACQCKRHTPTEESKEKRSRRMAEIWEDPDSSHNSEERHQKLVDSLRGRAQEFTVSEGYRILGNQWDHPLAASGALAEHRKVLWEKLGCESLDCEHECYWSCGRVLTWGGIHGICADHLDGDTLNNDPENLVPSCIGCNTNRARAGDPLDWCPRSRTSS